MLIREKIKQLRKQKKISQRKMADFLNVTNPAISMWENGIRKIDVDTLTSIAKCLDTPMYFFFEEENNKVNEILAENPLNDLEKKLLKSFKKLNFANQNYIVGYTESYLELQQKQSSQQNVEKKDKFI